ncbi:MAG: MiaB/RimO family radical SAM methylthiotransferase [Acidimicrobiales bacterium]
MVGSYWVETLGCAKNQVDSDKLSGVLQADRYVAAADASEADLVVVNTCAFVEAARQESIESILYLAGRRRPGARLVVTGCMAERYGPELADALPEVDLVAGFGVALAPAPAPVAVELGRRPPAGFASFDLLNLPRPPAAAPWAYVKVAEGCDRRCGFCAIPSFRGRQRSRLAADVLAEVEALGTAEVVLVAQDLASYGRDIGQPGAIVDLVGEVARRCQRTRLLYLYPSDLSAELIGAIGATGCPYFDLSLQHVSRPLLRRMRRWGDGRRFAERIARIRGEHPDAALRSSFIVGYPGETEEDHDHLLGFLAEVELDWAGFFAFCPEEGTHAAGLPDHVPPDLARERLGECGELQDRITAGRRQDLIGRQITVLVDSAGVARSHREAPEIDGLVLVPDDLAVGTFNDVTVVGAEGPDLEAVAVPAGVR